MRSRALNVRLLLYAFPKLAWWDVAHDGTNQYREPSTAPLRVMLILLVMNSRDFEAEAEHT